MFTTLRQPLSLIVVSLLAFQMPVALRAGGFLETFDITGNVPSPIPGHVVARVIPIRWDLRSIPVQFRVNDTLNPIPNPLGPVFLSLADATSVLQDSLDVWNDIDTSYIQMDIVGTVSNPGLRGFDLKNEVTFRTAASFGAIASSPSTSLITDITLGHGTDIDGDGDSDVSSAIATATDVDSDGDIEFPAGFYKAGTIFDNDVQFNTKASNGFRFTTADAAVDTVTRSVDLMAVAVHEFGHSIGLSHTLDNQISAQDGTGASMFPFIDTGDPASELSQRTLGSDDIAWASYHYPEGTAGSGLPALQPGDVAFSAVYGLITGEVRHGVLNQPVAGASVAAIEKTADRLVASGFSGTTQLSFNPITGGLFLVSPAFNILDGRYTIPAPQASYGVAIEPVDGNPVATGSISFTAQIGGIFGQLNFSEEFFNKNKEAAIEVRPGQQKNVHVNPGHVKAGIDFITTKNVNINNFGNLNAIGFGGMVGGRYYAVRIPASQVIAAAAPFGGRIGFQAVAYDTFVIDSSVVPIFAEAMLTTGTVNATTVPPTATLNLAEPLDGDDGFVAQDGDFSPFYLKNGHSLGRRVMRGIADGSITDLFLVLRVPPSPFPGVSGVAPLIGLDGPTPSTPVNDVPIFGLSYTSNDGVTFTQNTAFNFRFSLVLSEPNVP